MAILFLNGSLQRRCSVLWKTRIELLIRQLLRTEPYGLFQSRNTSEIMNPFRHLSGLLGRVVSPAQEQHRQALATIHASSGIRTYDPCKEPNLLNVIYINFIV
jgi:hypothetical protein